MSKAPESSWFRWVGATAALAAVIAPCWGPAAGAAPVGEGRPGAQDFVAAALQNQTGLTRLSFTAFRVSQQGWEIYAPLVAHEIGAKSEPGAPAFARALATWQSARGLGRSGIMDAATLAAMNALWTGRRPFVAISRRACPPSPSADNLAPIPLRLAYGGKAMMLRPAALAAYERMVAVARAELSGPRDDGNLLTIFSAFRSKAYDAERCARQGDCGGLTRATCSAHATGLAVDIYLGAAPGFQPDSSNAVNRLYLSQGKAYRWLVQNAGGFGFMPYAYEPWHWEWTGEPVVS